ncbi:Xylose isomerase domain protein TIM barrel [Beijerinckia indica subsp. indica ATCC 9039]|uniref:Xylose isomerase domain protein TIM barrel n=2 Tax=Beijerinckia TaxID=532 RepID=B2IKB4_BEII9|nr:Xylose isomerase domain protein TIM barrel [Beijerinckia indica subsp. indica ATCC 9039]
MSSMSDRNAAKAPLGGPQAAKAMRTIKGPAVFLAQFAGDAPPFNTLDGLAGWAAEKGFLGVQIPSWDRRLFDVETAAESQDYCDEIKGRLAEHGLVVTELASHLQGQLVALHPAFDIPADSFAAPEVRANPQARQEWAVRQLLAAARASRRLGLDRHVTFSGSLLWPYLYPYPQWPEGLINDAFDELARRWRPILDAFDAEGVDLCYEIHPTEDLHDGLTFEMFLDRVDDHARCNIMYDPSHLLLQSMDYLAYIDHYHDRIKMFHVKDAEFRPTGKTGAYGGFQPWLSRAGRFRSPGDGQIDFGGIFSKLAGYGFDGWAVLEWECCLKHPEDGAAEGAAFIKRHIIHVAERAFDDFVKADANRAANRAILGLDAGDLS